jgi:hypothetical protein
MCLVCSPSSPENHNPQLPFLLAMSAQNNSATGQRGEPEDNSSWAKAEDNSSWVKIHDEDGFQSFYTPRMRSNIGALFGCPHAAPDESGMSEAVTSLSSIYGTQTAVRPGTGFLGDTDNLSWVQSFVRGAAASAEAKVVDIALLSPAEEGSSHALDLPLNLPPKDSSSSFAAPKDLPLDLSFWLSYAWLRMLDQLKLVVPLLFYTYLYRLAVLRSEAHAEYGPITGGMLLVVVGLAMFLEGLKLGVMPMAEVIGKSLPTKCPLPVALGATFLLGMAVTFAEPAIGALKEIGGSLNSFRSPFLYYMLNKWELYVVLVVGAGVGVAAVVGTLRFIYRVDIKPVLYCVVGATLLVTVLGSYLNPASAQLIVLAWDCGAMTSGPVTVPILLSLGLSISAAARNDSERERGTSAYSTLESNGSEDLSESPESAPFRRPPRRRKGEGGALEGFGIVTLAALFPVIGVSCLGFILTRVKSEGQILSEVHGECYLASRETCLTTTTSACEWNTNYDRCEFGREQKWDAFVNLGDFAWREETAVEELVGAVTALGPLVLMLFFLLRSLGEPLPVVCARAHGRTYRMGVWTGLASAVLGLVIFNIGLTKGLRQLGNDTGTAIPQAFLDTSDPVLEPHGNSTPYYDGGLGIFLTLVFLWFLGAGTILVAPVLSQLASTVETLTKGRYWKGVIFYSVGLGMATGMALGALKVITAIPLIYVVLPLYLLAMLMSVHSEDDLVQIAWDSARVSTGPVTKPLVLALGTGIGSVVCASEEGGLGLLTLTSTGPVVFVLISGYFCRAQEPVPRPFSSGGWTSAGAHQRGKIPASGDVVYGPSLVYGPSSAVGLESTQLNSGLAHTETGSSSSNLYFNR